MTKKIPARLKLPARFVDGHWEFAFGGSVPVRPGAEAELIVESSLITDLDFLKRVTQEVVVQFLPEGTELLVALTPGDKVDISGLVAPVLDPRNGQYTVAGSDLPSVSTRFAKVKLGVPADLFPGSVELDAQAGGLWLTVTGLWDCELNSPAVSFPPEYGLEPARSLNHAFTRLSEKFETHRISHTGNVFQRVFYRERSGWWRPLRQLREIAIDRAENAILASGWAAIEASLGWCRWEPRSGAGDE